MKNEILFCEVLTFDVCKRNFPKNTVGFSCSGVALAEANRGDSKNTVGFSCGGVALAEANNGIHYQVENLKWEAAQMLVHLTIVLGLITLLDFVSEIIQTLLAEMPQP